jgi:hypothetical protein
VTLEALDARFTKLEYPIERGFAATAGDIADIKRDMATREQMIVLGTQTASIERELAVDPNDGTAVARCESDTHRSRRAVWQTRGDCAAPCALHKEGFLRLKG